MPIPSVAYIVSFLESCMDSGMCKEAAYIMLCKASFDHECLTNPWYREGVEEMCKKAIPLKSLALLGGGAAAAAGAWKHLDNADQAWVNQLPAGSSEPYDPSKAGELARAAADKASTGVGVINNATYPKQLRLQELQNAVNAKATGSASALPEITRLQKDLSGLEGQRAGMLSSIEGNIANQQKYQGRLQEQIGEEDARSNSMWTGMRRWLGSHGLPGGMKDNSYYDDRKQKLQMADMNEQDSIRASQEAMRRLGNGYGGTTAPKQTAAPTIQSIL